MMGWWVDGEGVARRWGGGLMLLPRWGWLEVTRGWVHGPEPPASKRSPRSDECRPVFWRGWVERVG